MASTDAKPIPQKNVAYRVTFPIFDADGDLVTGAAGLDSEISKDGGTFADCTNEATEIATASGMYYLDLTSTEMNADTVAIIVKTSTTGAKTTPIVLYPEEAGDIRANVTQWSGTNVAAADTAGYPKVTIKSGTGTGEVSLSSGAVVLAAAGLDAITDTTISTGDMASLNFRKRLRLLWQRFFNEHVHNEGAGTIVTKNDSNVAATTQAVTDSAGVQTVGKASAA